MILIDRQIAHRCLSQRMVEPYDPKLLNPASLDILVGETAIIETAHGWKKTDLTHYSKSNPYMVGPKEFLLVSSMETFNMPVDICGEFRLKSSRAREGWNQHLAVWLDNGWHGSKLTLELVNNLCFSSLPLYPGLKIGQIIFYQTEVPNRHYGQTGRYNGDTTVMASKG